MFGETTVNKVILEVSVGAKYNPVNGKHFNWTWHCFRALAYRSALHSVVMSFLKAFIVMTNRSISLLLLNVSRKLCLAEGMLYYFID